MPEGRGRGSAVQGKGRGTARTEWLHAVGQPGSAGGREQSSEGAYIFLIAADVPVNLKEEVVSPGDAAPP